MVRLTHLNHSMEFVVGGDDSSSRESSNPPTTPSSPIKIPGRRSSMSRNSDQHNCHHYHGMKEIFMSSSLPNIYVSPSSYQSTNAYQLRPSRNGLEMDEQPHRRKLTSSNRRDYLVDVDHCQELILSQEDTIGHERVTVEDCGPKRIRLGSLSSAGYTKYPIHGNYKISLLLQELSLLSEAEERSSIPSSMATSATITTTAFGRRRVIVNEKVLQEDPVSRLVRLIESYFWPALERKLDLEGLKQLIGDKKMADNMTRIYISNKDKEAYNYWTQASALADKSINLEIIKMPPLITPEFIYSLHKKPGLLALAIDQGKGRPFIIPGGRFNEQYGWDSYFSTLGLLTNPNEHNIDLTIGMVDNLVYQIRNYGMVLNANRTYYLGRSQPPFLTAMALDVFKSLRNARESSTKPPKTSTLDVESLIAEAEEEQKILEKDLAWLRKVFSAAIKEYKEVWMSKPRFVAENEIKSKSFYSCDFCNQHTNNNNNSITKDSKKSMAAERWSKEPPSGLSRYWGGLGGAVVPPETEPSHFDSLLKGYLKKHSYEDRTSFIDDFNRSSIAEKNVKCSSCNTGSSSCTDDDGDGDEKTFTKTNVKDKDLQRYFMHDRAMRESGHDTTYRLDSQCASLLTIDLNSCLYRYEIDIASYLEQWEMGNGIPLENESDNNDANDDVDEVVINSPPATWWRMAAERRREMVNEYLWDPLSGSFQDWNIELGKRTGYESATMLWSCWSNLATKDQAHQMIIGNNSRDKDDKTKSPLQRLEQPGGLASGTRESLERVLLEKGNLHLTSDHPNRQWDWPFGWAPHQILAWKALEEYGYQQEKERLTYKWLYMITRSFSDFNGVVPEKFDVVKRSHKMDVEYGNVGTDFRRVPREGFAWMNASYLIGISGLSKLHRRALRALVKPEDLFL